MQRTSLSAFVVVSLLLASACKRDEAGSSAKDDTSAAAPTAMGDVATGEPATSDKTATAAPTADDAVNLDNGGLKIRSAFCEGSGAQTSGLLFVHKFTLVNLSSVDGAAPTQGANAKLSDELVNVRPLDIAGGITQEIPLTCVDGAKSPDRAALAKAFKIAPEGVVIACKPTLGGTSYRVAVVRDPSQQNAVMKVYRDLPFGLKNVLTSASCQTFALGE
jgi:hypothetical protein